MAKSRAPNSRKEGIRLSFCAEISFFDSPGGVEETRALVRGEPPSDPWRITVDDETKETNGHGLPYVGSGICVRQRPQVYCGVTVGRSINVHMGLDTNFILPREPSLSQSNGPATSSDMHFLSIFNRHEREKSPAPAAKGEPHERVKSTGATLEEDEEVGTVFTPLGIERHHLPSSMAKEGPHEYREYVGIIPEDHKGAEDFCTRGRIERPELLPSDMVPRPPQDGCQPWRMVLPTCHNFKGRVKSGTGGGSPGMTKVFTDRKCQYTCIFSNLPIMASLYNAKEQKGVYYEVVIRKMRGIIVIGNETSPSLSHKATTSSLLTWL